MRPPLSDLPLVLENVSLNARDVAIVRDLEILVFNEPTASLDPAVWRISSARSPNPGSGS